MKKKITFLTSIFIIVMLLLTSSVFAVETFTYGEDTYKIEEINLKTDSLSDEIIYLGMDKNNNYIIGDGTTGNFYKVNENECIEMSVQEILDFINSLYNMRNYVEDDLNIYQEKEYISGSMNYIVTEDEVVDSNKEYYQKIDHGEGGYEYQTVENPDLANGTYLELVFLAFPKSATIDENITYYKNVEGVYSKVENPTAEEILEYQVIGKLQDYGSVTKIGQLSEETYNKIFPETNYSYRIVYDEESNEIYLLMDYDESQKSIIYKADGTIVKEFDTMMTIEPVGNEFFMVAEVNEIGEIDSSKITIIDKKGNTVIESEDILFCETIRNTEATIYLKHELDTLKFYNMYVNKEEDNSNTNIDNNNNNNTNTEDNNNTNTDNNTNNNQNNNVGNNNTTTNTNQDTGEKDDTPKTGSITEDSNVGLYITLIIAIIGVIATSIKRK